MLPKNERIKYSGLFQQAFEKGKRLNSKNFCLIYTASLERLQNSYPLVGFNISKKYSKKAVLRNKIKRQMREIYKKFRAEANNSKKLKALGLLVFKVKNEAKCESFQEIEKELSTLLTRLPTA